MSDEPTRVLLVDDDPDFRRGLAEWLGRRGYQVDTAADGEAALRCVAQEPPYQVALIDLALEPGPNGIEVMRRIRLRDPEIAPVIFTGFGLNPRDGLEAMRAGAYRYLPKSAHKEEIDMLIRSAVDYYAIRRQLARTTAKVETLQVLSEARQRKLAELTALNEIGRAIAATVQLNQLPRLIYKQTSQVIDTTNFFVALYEWETHQLNFVLRYEHGERVAPHRHSADHGLTGYLVCQRRPLLLRSVEENRAFRREHGIELIGEEARSWLGVPILSGDRVLGAIAVQDYEREGVYGEDQWELLQIIANYTAVAMENAELFAQLDRVGQAARAVTMSLELREVLRQIVTLAAAVARSDHTSVVLVEDDEPFDSVEDFGDRFPEIPPLHRRARPDGRTREVIRTGEPVVFDRVEADDPAHNPYLRDVGIRSYVGLPLKVKEELVGVLFVHSFERDAFRDSMQLLTIFAHHAAIAIANARLFREVQERAQTRGALLRVEQQITSAIPYQLKTVLEGIARGACEVTGADCAVIYPFDVGRQSYDVESVAACGLIKPHAFRPSGKLRGFGASLAASITREPGGLYAISDTEADSQLKEARFIQREAVRAFVSIRLEVADEPVGVFFVNWRKPHRFSDNEMNDIRILAHHAAIAIQNARLYERAGDQLRKRIEELVYLYQIDRQITATLEPGRVFELILKAALELTEGKRGELWLIDSTSGELALEMAQGEPLGEPGPTRLQIGQGVVGKAVREGQLRLVRDVRRGFWARTYPQDRSRVRSVMAVPIRLGDEDLGAIAVESPEPDAFDPDEQRLLERLATQAVIAVHNARQYQALEKKRSQLAALHEVGTEITASLDLERVQEMILARAVELTGAHIGTLQEIDAESQELVMTFVFSPQEYGPVTEYRRIPLPLGLEGRVGITGTAALSRQSIRADDVRDYPQYIPFQDDTRSELAVPLLHAGQCIGVLNVEHRERAAFSQDDQTLLEALADQAAIALQNARLYREATERQVESHALQQVGGSLAGALDREAVLEVVMREALRLTNTDSGSILLWDGERGGFTQTLTTGPDGSLRAYQSTARQQEGIAYTIVTEQCPIVITDTRHDSRVNPMAIERGRRAFIGVPLVSRAGTIGVLYVSSSAPRRFPPRMVTLLTALAGQATVAIEYSRQYEELNRARGETAAAEAVAWMGIFGSNWSHGINQRTFAIRNYLATLRTTLPTEGLPSELLDLIEEVTNEIQYIPLTSQLPVTPGTVQAPVEIDDALREQVEKWCKRRDDVERVYHLGCATVRAAIDREWLDVALEKLINNALKAMPEGGRLEIASERVGERIFVRLADTGRGIPDETRPYFLKQSIPHEISAKMGRKGTGVGVLIARLIFRRYGGDLDLLWSERGKGTALRITLPCTPDSTLGEE